MLKEYDDIKEAIKNLQIIEICTGLLAFVQEIEWDCCIVWSVKKKQKGKTWGLQRQENWGFYQKVYCVISNKLGFIKEQEVLLNMIGEILILGLLLI